MRMGDVERGAPIRLSIDGDSVDAYAGETVAAVLLALDRRRFRDDRGGRARGLFCNMGTCSECMLWIADAAGHWRRRRACLVPVTAGMRVATGQEAPHAD